MGVPLDSLILSGRDGSLRPTVDNRTEASGFHVGQRVRVKNIGQTGRIAGFGEALHSGDTVFIHMDDPTIGNRGKGMHSCGDSYVEAVE